MAKDSDKVGIDPKDKTAEQRLKDEFGTEASGKSIPQMVKDKVGDNPSTGELARRQAVKAEEAADEAGNRLKAAAAAATPEKAS